MAVRKIYKYKEEFEQAQVPSKEEHDAFMEVFNQAYIDYRTVEAYQKEVEQLRLVILDSIPYLDTSATKVESIYSSLGGTEAYNLANFSTDLSCLNEYYTKLSSTIGIIDDIAADFSSAVNKLDADREIAYNALMAARENARRGYYVINFVSEETGYNGDIIKTYEYAHVVVVPQPSDEARSAVETKFSNHYQW